MNDVVFRAKTDLESFYEKNVTSVGNLKWVELN